MVPCLIVVEIGTQVVVVADLVALNHEKDMNPEIETAMPKHAIPPRGVPKRIEVTTMAKIRRIQFNAA